MQTLRLASAGKLIRVFLRRAVVAVLIPAIVLSSVSSSSLAQAAQAQNATPPPANNSAPTGQLEDLSGLPSQIDVITRDPDLYTPADNIAYAIEGALNDAGIDTGEWRWKSNPDGSVTFTSSSGSKVTGTLDGAGHLIITKAPGLVLPDPGTGTLDFSGHPGAVHNGDGGTGAQPSQPNGQPGGTLNNVTFRPQDVQQLAMNRALEQYLGNLTQSVAGDWLDQNGTPVSKPTLEALILKQLVILRLLTQARLTGVQLADNFKKMTPAQQQTFVANLQKQAANILPKYQAYVQWRDSVSPEMQAIYVSAMADYTNLIAQGKLALAQDRLDSINGGAYAKYIRARNAFYSALNANPLLGVQLSPEGVIFSGGPHFFESLLNPSTSLDDLIKLTSQNIDGYNNGLTTQIDRISQFQTVPQYLELGGPTYAQIDAMVAAQFGEFGRQLINGLQGAYGSAEGLAAYDKAVNDFIVAIGSAIPVLGFGFMAIQVYRDGDSYVVALSDEQNAEQLAPVSGAQAIAGATENREAAGSKLATTAVSTGAAVGFAVVGQALQSGKSVKVVYNFGGKSGEVILGGENAAVAADNANAINAANPTVPNGAGVPPRINPNPAPLAPNEIPNLPPPETVPPVINPNPAPVAPSEIPNLPPPNQLPVFPPTPATPNGPGVPPVINPNPAPLAPNEIPNLPGLTPAGPNGTQILKPGEIPGVPTGPNGTQLYPPTTVPNTPTGPTGTQILEPGQLGPNGTQILTPTGPNGTQILKPGEIPGVPSGPNGTQLYPQLNVPNVPTGPTGTQIVNPIIPGAPGGLVGTPPRINLPAFEVQLQPDGTTLTTVPAEAAPPTSNPFDLGNGTQTLPPGSTTLFPTQMYPSGTPTLSGTQTLPPGSTMLGGGPGALKGTPVRINGRPYAVTLMPDGTTVTEVGPDPQNGYDPFTSELPTFPATNNLPTPNDTQSLIPTGPNGTQILKPGEVPGVPTGTNGTQLYPQINVPNTPTGPTGTEILKPGELGPNGTQILPATGPNGTQTLKPGEIPGVPTGPNGTQIYPPLHVPNVVTGPTGTQIVNPVIPVGLGGVTTSREPATLPANPNPNPVAITSVRPGSLVLNASNLSTAINVAASAPGISAYQMVVVYVASSSAELQRGRPAYEYAQRNSPVGGFFIVPAAYHPSGSFGTSGLHMLAPRAESSQPSGGVTYSIVSNGKSTGSALELDVLDETGQFQMANLQQGLVLEPVKQGSAKPVTQRLPTGVNLLTQALTSYCLEFAKLPPEAGMLYRIAPPAMQDQFKSVMPLLQAAQRSGADDDTIQYGIWSLLGHGGQQQFADMFLEHAKKNAQAMKVNWTKQMEQAVLGLVPARWRTVAGLLQQAQQLSSNGAPKN